jgi:hypothetical protein
MDGVDPFPVSGLGMIALDGEAERGVVEMGAFVEDGKIAEAVLDGHLSRAAKGVLEGFFRGGVFTRAEGHHERVFRRPEIRVAIGKNPLFLVSGSASCQRYRKKKKRREK